MKIIQLKVLQINGIFKIYAFGYQLDHQGTPYGSRLILSIRNQPSSGFETMREAVVFMNNINIPETESYFSSVCNCKICIERILNIFLKEL